jgi:Rps23 Pro-64 3,4-dihydroxylase Tpa1-like proline 4-hydroxylase
MRNKDDLMRTQGSLDDARKVLGEQQQAFKQAYEQLKQEQEDTVKRLVNESLRRNVALATEVKHLRVKLDEQDRMLDIKSQKERELTQDIVDRMKDIIALRGEKEPKRARVVEENPEELGGFIVEASKEAAVEEEEELLTDNLKTLIGTDKYQDTSSISPVEDLCPMIESALDHGDTPELIVKSLRSCGYSRKDIDLAFSKLGR